MSASRLHLSRRRFLASSGAAALAVGSGLAMPRISRAANRPSFSHGVQSGDVTQTTGMVWTRTDRPARVDFEWATTESFRNATRLAALDTSPASDLTVKRMLDGLPSDQDIFWRAIAHDLSDVNASGRSSAAFAPRQARAAR